MAQSQIGRLMLLLGLSVLLHNLQNVNAAPSYTWPEVTPGPSWSVPRFSLPSCLGVLPDWHMQWWYYAGYGVDAAGKSYSLFFHVDRVQIPPPMDVTSTGLYVAFGIPGRTPADDLFLYAGTVGTGFATTPEEAATATSYLPPVTDWSFELSHKPSSAQAGKGLQFSYNREASKGNAVGSPGAVYNLHASGLLNETNAKEVPGKVPYSADLVFEDQRGVVLEGTNNGDAYLAMQPRASWEFGFPSLKVKSGSISYNNTVIQLVGGSIWLDMQTVKVPPGPDSELIPSRGIYLGTWSSISFNNGVILQAWNLWQKQDQPGTQWISGTKVGRPPAYVAGSIYYPLDKVRKGEQGGAPLWSTADFDLNILNPFNPKASPHYTSPASNKTYSLAWQVTVNTLKLGKYGLGIPRVLYIYPIMLTGQSVPEMHMLGQGTPTYFYELACIVYADRGRKRPVGRAFIEQMGFN